jgi:hypothetical protein
VERSLCGGTFLGMFFDSETLGFWRKGRHVPSLRDSSSGIYFDRGVVGFRVCVRTRKTGINSRAGKRGRG